MARFFTSDLHFSHRNVINFCDRPYSSIEEMDEAIINQWNTQVNPEDEVYFLGDFGINKKKCLDSELIARLNGKKHIILGNHDEAFTRWHNQKVNLMQIFDKFNKAGWSSVGVQAKLKLKNGRIINLTHLPPSNEHDTRYSQFKIENEPDEIYCHGHLHAHYRKKKNLIDVAFDVDLKLLSEDDLISIIDDEREFIPTRLTEKYKNNIPLILMPFEEEVKKKNIRRVESPDRKLVLYNYTDQCTYDKAWNDITRVSRGIIFEKDTGNLIAMPFPKFFNLGEMPETELKNLPEEPYTVTEKMDGSLGIVYYYDNKWNVATRGSFTSEQAIKAQDILKKYDMSNVPTSLTLLVEIIYPENKIVVNYGNEEELVLLSVINRDTQEEYYFQRKPISQLTGMPEVKTYFHTINKMIELQKILPKDEEGFVVRFKSGLRVKIKGEEYLRIHKLISCISPLTFWENMKDGIVSPYLLIELPEEFRKEADEIIEKLETQYKKVYSEAYKEFLNAVNKLDINLYLYIDCHEYRKKLGLYIKEHNPKHGHVFFNFYNNNDEGINKYIMNTIKPSGNVWRDI